MTLLRAALLLGLAVFPHGDEAGEPKSGLKSIDKGDVGDHLRFLASPTLEGRDSPSRGLMLAAEHVAGVFNAAGLVPTGDSLTVWSAVKGDLPGQEGLDAPPPWSVPGRGSAQAESAEPAEPAEPGRTAVAKGTYLRPFEVPRMASVRGKLTRPVPDKCLLELESDGGEPTRFVYGQDFVPLAGHGGGVRGELAWVGFGIKSRKQKYDSIGRQDLDGKVAVLVEGDPQAGKNFGGSELTAEASIWNKLKAVADAGAAGAVIVRRRPERPDWMKSDADMPPLGYRYTWASWNPPSTDKQRGAKIPAIEVSPECASALMGKDVAGLIKAIDRGAKPKKVTLKERRVAFEAVVEGGALTLPNVVGILPGRDPEVADEYVIIGAHMDHVGAGVRGRIGFGADDNASGTSALLEIVEAMALARPRRSILFTVFSGEEDGLLGSANIAQNLPVPRDQVVAMVNLDMIGRGEASEAYCLGFKQNPRMEKVVHRAQDLGRTGVKRIKRCDDPGLFKRSDHHSFHEVGIPVVFFFENYPLEQNKDYHTWRDTFDGVNVDKVTNTARLAFCTAWLLAEDDDRLPTPGG